MLYPLEQHTMADVLHDVWNMIKNKYVYLTKVSAFYQLCISWKDLDWVSEMK